MGIENLKNQDPLLGLRKKIEELRSQEDGRGGEAAVERADQLFAAGQLEEALEDNPDLRGLLERLEQQLGVNSDMEREIERARKGERKQGYVPEAVAAQRELLERKIEILKSLGL